MSLDAPPSPFTDGNLAQRHPAPMAGDRHRLKIK